MTISIVRHADAIPDFDAHVDREGYDALGLSARGTLQADALARRLTTATAIDAIYTSPTRRARETADAIARALGMEPHTDERLREVGMPVVTLDHLQPGERAAAVRGLLQRFGKTAMRDGTWTALAQTEDPARVRKRMRAFVNDMQRAHAGRRVLAVSHAGAINAYFADVLGLARDYFFPTHNTAISVARVTERGTIVVRLNDSAHLDGIAP